MPFIPTDEPGLECWLKADAGTYQDSGLTTPATADADPIRGWQDQSGNAKHFISAAGGPALAAAAQNGLNAARFPGTNGNALKCAGLAAVFLGTNAWTMLMVVRSTVLNRIAFALSEAGTDNYAFFQPCWSIATQGAVMYADNTAAQYAYDSIGTQNDYATIGVAYDGTTLSVSTYGSAGASPLTWAGFSPDFDQVVLGGYVGAGSPNGALILNGDVCEFLVYDHALSSEVAADANAYLMERWDAGPQIDAPVVSASDAYWDGVLHTFSSSNSNLNGRIIYTVQRSATGAGVWTTVGTTRALRFFDKGLARPSTYDYRIRGSYGGVDGAWSSTVSGSTLSGATAATVTNIAPCLGWSKADALVLSNNDPVATWTDSSAASNDYEQATSARRPVFKTNIQNSLPAVLFDSAQTQWMQNDAGIGVALSGYDTPRSVILAGAHRTIVAAQCWWMLARALDQVPTNDYLLDPARNAWASAARNDPGDAEQIRGWGDIDTDWHVHAFYLDDQADAQFCVDGTVSNSGAFGVGQLTSDMWSLGVHRRNVTADLHLDGYVGEIIVYYDNPSAAGKAWLQTYLQVKWDTPADGQSFDPAHIPDILGHFRDDSIDTQIDGGAVALWLNKTNGGLYAGNSAYFELEAVGTVTRTNAAINGRAAVTLAGGYLKSEHDLLPPYFSGTGQAFTVFGVFKADGVASLQELWSLGNSATSAAHSARITAAPAWAAKEINDAAGTATIAGGVPTAAAHAVIYTFDGTTGTLYVNGVAVATGAMPGGAATFNRFALGGLLGAAASNLFAGKVGEFGLYERALTGDERRSLFVYMGTRWGVSIAGQSVVRPIVVSWSPRFYVE